MINANRKKSQKQKEGELELMKLESGTPVILLRKDFLAKEIVNINIQSRLVRFTGKSIAIELDGAIHYIPTKFINNRESNINADPPVIHLPGWFSLKHST